MGTLKEGGNPYTIDPSTLRVSPDQSRFGSGFKKPEALSSEEPQQQPSSPYRELSEQLKQNPRRSGGIAGGESHRETYRRLRQARKLDDKG
jgi:hypothetical protein